MLVACRLAGLAGLEAYHAGLNARTQMRASASPPCVLSPRRAPENRASRGCGWFWGGRRDAASAASDGVVEYCANEACHCQPIAR
jgi:hypothetical protein